METILDELVKALTGTLKVETDVVFDTSHEQEAYDLGCTAVKTRLLEIIKGENPTFVGHVKNTEWNKSILEFEDVVFSEKGNKLEFTARLSFERMVEAIENEYGCYDDIKSERWNHIRH